MQNELFHKKTIEKLTTKIKISPKQKKAALDWLELLEKDKLLKEKNNYFRFGEIILRELLGFDIRDMSFEDGNIEFSFTSKEGRQVLGIEAKGTKTKDLFSEQKGYREGQDTPVTQLWTYMGKLNLDYGIATNYRHFVLLDRLRGSSTYYIFDFLDIKNNENKLKEFVTIFSKEQIIDNKFIEKLEEESAIEEREFTEEFYKLFHETRLMLIKEFEENADLSKEIIIHYSQLYLNRLMFIFFAEDSDKLDKRLFEDLLISSLRSEMLISDHSRLVSDTTLALFTALDQGSETPRKIFGFNGGLFKEKIPPTIFFKDLRNKEFFKEIYQGSSLKKELELDEQAKSLINRYENKLNPIIKNILLLGSFDFKSEISVNILGHIFEQSLTDLELLKSNETSKRKKDGIYYTPEYITSYICRKTIINYLSKDKAENARELVLEYSKDIAELEEKFKDLRILDPACGSGAFLLKAVEVLLDIHREIQLFKQDEGQYTALKISKSKDEGVKVKRSKSEGQLMLLKWSEEEEAREIIENNIFGVDLNPESVDITKLSLFLKIAKKNKKLIDLSKNIKCGNSLMDGGNTPRPFQWQKEFPFKFDIIIGNPPYGAELSLEDKQWLNQKYSIGSTDTAQLMMKLSYSILKDGGFNGFIIPKAFLFASNWSSIRSLFLDELDTIIDCKKVWQEVKLEQVIYILRKECKTNRYTLGIRNKIKIIENSTLDKKYCSIFGFVLNGITEEELKIGLKIKEIKTMLTGDLGKNQRGDMFQQKIQISGKYPVLAGENIQRYLTKGIKGYVPEEIKFEEKAKIKYNSVLVQRLVAHIENPKDHIKITATIEKGYLIVDTINQVTLNQNISNKYILSLLNSNLLSWYCYRFIFAKAIRTMQFDNPTTSKIPIPFIPLNLQKPFIDKVELMLEMNKNFFSKKMKFLQIIKNKYNLNKTTQRLENFYKLDFTKFIKEIESITKTKLSLVEQDFLHDYFNHYNSEVGNLYIQISDVDKEINKMIYELYHLDDKEIKIVEKSFE